MKSFSDKKQQSRPSSKTEEDEIPKPLRRNKKTSDEKEERPKSRNKISTGEKIHEADSRPSSGNKSKFLDSTGSEPLVGEPDDQCLMPKSRNKSPTDKGQEELGLRRPQSREWK